MKTGSIGLAGALMAGDHLAAAQAQHGSAPDIAGKDVANPTSMILSMAMLQTEGATRSRVSLNPIVQFARPRANRQRMSDCRQFSVVGETARRRLLVSLRKGRRKYVFPLCDLEAVDHGSSNYQLVKDYAIWFANR